MKRLENALRRWRGANYRGISSASRGERTAHNGPNYPRMNKMARNMIHGFKPKNNWNNVNYIYRGISLNNPSNFKRIQGYSSWTHNINVAKTFSNQPNKPIMMILRINTKLLKGAPVINVGSWEGEYILPPMHMELGEYRNGIFSPVKAVKFNQRWVANNRPSIIPRMAARKIRVTRDA